MNTFENSDSNITLAADINYCIYKIIHLESYKIPMVPLQCFYWENAGKVDQLTDS
jgi:hypothetical protein